MEEQLILSTEENIHQSTNLPLIEVRTTDSSDNYSREVRKTTSRILEENVLDKYTKEYSSMC